MGSTKKCQDLMKLMELSSCVVPMALRAAVQLNVMDILAKHGGQDQYLSASQIVSHFETPLAPTTSHEQAASSLDRVLRVLASYGLLASSLHSCNSHQGEPLRTYGLNSLSQYLVHKTGQGSFAPYLLLTQQSIKFMHNLHESILDGSVPLDKAFGSSLFSSLQANPSDATIFNNGMAAHTELFMHSFLEIYNGFDDITNLMDIGGNVGASLRMITSKHPHIKGINFDQPHIVAGAPKYPGIEHVGGDMFQMIPKADVIFMKWILHDWTDDQCLKILENCHKALPNKGKLILVDAIIPEDLECGPAGRLAFQSDLGMFACCTGKERTKIQLERIVKASGFARFEVVCNVLGCGVMEIHKEVTSS